ncbi:unnamed protein product [Prorocentrum cordatum]|uniref:Uncharacterized protein n=1 Tax=Prorocentrum cordatum TaxID=2364126 RepID=A0ABN9SY97_9DINO|nr:unnamed protein product [Polarella glacialis]
MFLRTDVNALAPEELATDYGHHQAYRSVEEDDEAWSDIMALVQRGWLRQCGSLGEVAAFLDGEAPVLSKFGIVTKTRNGRIKRRLILDSQVSGVSAAASKLERVLLPKLLDVAVDVLDVIAANTAQAAQSRDAGAEFFALDFQDAS